MKLTKVKSSNVAGYHYDEDAEKLTVEFHGGRRYAYDQVTPEMVEKLASANSIGVAFNQIIKPLGGVRLEKESPLMPKRKGGPKVIVSGKVDLKVRRALVSLARHHEMTLSALVDLILTEAVTVAVPEREKEARRA